MNNTRNKWLIGIIAILLLSNIALLFFSLRPDPEKQRKDRPGLGFSEFLRKDVGFTPEQMKVFDSMRDEHFKRMRPMFENITNTKNNFYFRLSDTTLNDSNLYEVAAPIGKEQVELDVLIFRHFRRVRNMCTPEQQQRFDSLFPQIVKKMTGPNRNNRH
jgi:periplasmic protein CpxP/Spy